MAAGTKPSKVADKFILFALLLVILVGLITSRIPTFSSTLPKTDATGTVASARALIMGDVVVEGRWESEGCEGWMIYRDYIFIDIL